MDQKSRKLPRNIWEIIRRFPFIVPTFACLGIAFGYSAIFVLHDDNRPKEYFLRGIGILCLIFYSALLILWISKVRNKSWTAFFDRLIERENQRILKRLQTRPSNLELKVPLLSFSLIIFVIAVINYMFLIPKELNAALTLLIMFFAPTFLVLAVWDSFKIGFTLIRIMAVIFSALAAVLSAVELNKIIHFTQ
jgi:hypothetical protein